METIGGWKNASLLFNNCNKSFYGSFKCLRVGLDSQDNPVNTAHFRNNCSVLKLKHNSMCNVALNIILKIIMVEQSIMLNHYMIQA